MASAESLDLARGWMMKARSDFGTAHLLIKGQEKHFDTGSYHCQQAAEKALKAWLTAHEIVFPKTHVLEELLELCTSTAPRFAQFRDHCEALTPLAQEFRYPGDLVGPDADTAGRALRLAEEIYNFCEQQLTLEKK
jgi:HEPN domain-containing protein